MKVKSFKSLIVNLKGLTSGAVSDDPDPLVIDTAQMPGLLGGVASHHRLVVLPSQPSVLRGNYV